MRKAIWTILAVLLILLLLVSVGGFIYLRTSLPKTRGTVQMDGLDAAVEIVRDDAGVPHIFATTDHDAFFALGDNTLNSDDSRTVAKGAIPLANLTGPVVFRVWPLSRIGVPD